MVSVLMTYQATDYLLDVVVHRSFDLRQFYSCFNYQCFILVFKDIAITETITS